MRRPRDYDAELQALTNKAKAIKTRKQAQLGELVAATGGADLDMEILAGALLDAATTVDASKKEAWRKRGAAFFREGVPRAGKSTRRDGDGSAPSAASLQPSSGEAGAA